MTVRTNKNNWTGEKISVRVNVKSGEFSLDGSRYRVRKVNSEVSLIEVGSREGWDQIGSVFDMGKGEFVCTSVFSDLMRSAGCPFKAAIQTLCNG